MVSANFVRKISTKRNLRNIEKEILRASKDGLFGIRVGKNNYPEINDTLRKSGYEVRQGITVTFINWDGRDEEKDEEGSSENGNQTEAEI